MFIFRISLTLAINGLILAVSDAWAAYLHSTFFSETPFKFDDSRFFSCIPLLDDLKMSVHGFERYYSSVIVLSLISHVSCDNDELFFYCKFKLTPTQHQNPQLHTWFVKI